MRQISPITPGELLKAIKLWNASEDETTTG